MFCISAGWKLGRCNARVFPLAMGARAGFPSARLCVVVVPPSNIRDASIWYRQASEASTLVWVAFLATSRNRRNRALTQAHKLHNARHNCAHTFAAECLNMNISTRTCLLANLITTTLLLSLAICNLIARLAFNVHRASYVYPRHYNYAYLHDLQSYTQGVRLKKS